MSWCLDLKIEWRFQEAYKHIKNIEIHFHEMIRWINKNTIRKAKATLKNLKKSSEKSLNSSILHSFYINKSVKWIKEIPSGLFRYILSYLGIRNSKATQIGAVEDEGS